MWCIYGTQIRLRIEGPGEPYTTDEQPCNRVCYNGGELTKQGCDCQKTKYSGSCCDCKNIDCELCTWTEWSSCENATTRVRSRDEVRKAECAGARCEGPYMEEQNCDTVRKVLKSEEECLVFILIAVLSTSILVIICVFVCRRAAAAYKKKKKGYTRANDNDECEKDSFDMG
ncbi:uncharacterized protein [Antedon mediterranea]|uniref:uncharacterized protein n=1 Tax=Antedon mediterranea TaxID=105859 RepID=UPI003AF9DF06